MKKETLILITAGIILIVLIASRKKKISGPDVIRPGDKSNEVLGLQNALSAITGVRLKNMGLYDNETLSAVQYYMGNSNSLYDYEKGYVDKKFASDLFLIQSKTLKTQ